VQNVKGSRAEPIEQDARLLDAPSVSLDDQLAAAEREVRIRLRIFPQRVSTHRMSQRLADRELAAMHAIVATLRALIEERRP
jgi:hypothetical protein